jgi:serine/threonine protein phosphatase 1
MEPKWFVLGDVHGKYDNLMKLIKLIRDDGGLDFKNGDMLVQLGDRCDRGPDSFRVNNFFYKLEKRYPSQVICLKGNHEDMMLKAALNIDNYGFMLNGGGATMKSYKCYSNNPQVLGYKLQDCGHLLWHDRQPIFYETDKYIFTHAPIPLPEYRHNQASRDNFREDNETCFWSYGGDKLVDWVDPEPVPGKIAVSGHVHGMHKRKTDNQYIVPGIRQVGSSFCIDTGSGCHKAGYLTALELTTMTQYTSNGEVLIGEFINE